MDSSGDLMPLPDANKKSPRVYTNLQNIDLDTVTFANVQATGNPIAVEEMNEDEMRRLVLVNLARLVCAGEWSGLLDAGGGGGSGYGILVPQTEVGAYDGYEISTLAPWGATDTANSAVAAAGYPQGYPFVAPKTGDLDAIEIYVGTSATTSTLKVAIYEQDEDTHLPSTMLGFVEFDTTSTGAVEQTSFSGGTPSLTEGVQYWAVQARGDSGYAYMYGVAEDARSGLGPSNDITNMNNQATFVGNWATADPVDDVGTLNQYVSGSSMRFILKW